MKIYIYLTLFTFLFLNSCDSNDFFKETIIVASQKGKGIEPTGSSEREYYIIKKSYSENWEYLTSDIVGFHYEEGYEYVLEVGITVIGKPKQDQYPQEYSLIKIIYKTKKDSDL